jgi:UDP-2,3-diacylglucosamine hydrolase
MWMFDYFPRSWGYRSREPQVLLVGNQKLLIGHGDGLGPGDTTYKILKRFFNSRLCQWLFGWLHPNVGIWIASVWSKKSRITNIKKEETFQGEDGEFLLSYCNGIERVEHHDYYVFGHRHLPLDLKINEKSRYINLGEWVNFNTYAVYDGQNMEQNV